MRRPYHVVLRLGAPVALNHPWVHFDSVLLHLAAARVLGEAIYDLPTFTPADVASLPGMEAYAEAVYSRAGLKFASVAFFGPEPRYGTLDYYSRPDPGLPKRRIRYGIGPYRSWQLRWVYVAAEYAEFWAWGDPAVAADLLADLVGLGNDVRVGWGHVLDVRVEEVAEDRSVVADGRAMRPIPVRFLARYSEAVPLAWRPPYWSRDSVELCAPPGAEVDFGGPPRRVLRERFHGG
ncbi:MAG TPA: hypothetical protein VNO79_15750 [Actinomycetota bacterium]|nr:hypothetical protein [Actinomycetota bacterium]